MNAPDWLKYAGTWMGLGWGIAEWGSSESLLQQLATVGYGVIIGTLAWFLLVLWPGSAVWGFVSKRSDRR